MPEVWIPGAAEPSLDDFVERLVRQIERFTAGHEADETHVEVELGDGERLTLQAVSAEPVVPVNAIRRVTLGPAEDDRAQLGFALPGNERGAEPAA